MCFPGVLEDSTAKAEGCPALPCKTNNTYQWNDCARYSVWVGGDIKGVDVWSRGLYLLFGNSRLAGLFIGLVQLEVIGRVFGSGIVWLILHDRSRI